MTQRRCCRISWMECWRILCLAAQSSFTASCAGSRTTRQRICFRSGCSSIKTFRSESTSKKCTEKTASELFPQLKRQTRTLRRCGRLPQDSKSSTSSTSLHYTSCMRLNRSMVVQLNSLSRTMNKQSEVYKEIAFHYELLKKPDIASTFDTMRMVFSTMNECYVQVQRSVCEIVKPMNNQLYYEFLSLEKKLNGLGRLHEKLIDKESKLIEKKTLLFKQREVEKWELSPNCTVPIAVSYTHLTLPTICSV
eukprot:TRINITY_DN5423_c0_g2_i10.p1 TRINITY_DN5423_c0_g2~~TRINITY_DN5423_c0_g2_i10.p1  ORF type:complete len:250 (+),score=52.09 TRINITY_DN5423_c0_g2_i10:709-1458(+)